MSVNIRFRVMRFTSKYKKGPLGSRPTAFLLGALATLSICTQSKSTVLSGMHCYACCAGALRLLLYHCKVYGTEAYITYADNIDSNLQTLCANHAYIKCNEHQICLLSLAPQITCIMHCWTQFAVCCHLSLYVGLENHWATDLTPLPHATSYFQTPAHAQASPALHSKKLLQPCIHMCTLQIACIGYFKPSHSPHVYVYWVFKATVIMTSETWIWSKHEQLLACCHCCSHIFATSWRRPAIVPSHISAMSWRRHASILIYKHTYLAS